MRRNHLHFRPRLLQSYTGPQAADYVEVVVVALREFTVAEAHWNPVFGIRRGETEFRRHHANDGVRRAIEFHDAADDVRVRRKAPQPKTMTQDHRRPGAGAILLRQKCAPEHGSLSQESEEICRKRRPVHSLRKSPAGEIQ